MTPIAIIVAFAILGVRTDTSLRVVAREAGIEWKAFSREVNSYAHARVGETLGKGADVSRAVDLGDLISYVVDIRPASETLLFASRFVQLDAPATVEEAPKAISAQAQRVKDGKVLRDAKGRILPGYVQQAWTELVEVNA